MIAEASGACILAMGITQHSMGSDASTAISNLLLITGNYMRTGNGAYPLRGHNSVQGASVITGRCPIFFLDTNPWMTLKSDRVLKQVGTCNCPRRRVR
jgi:Molybdopterin oxidoreductase